MEDSLPSVSVIVCTFNSGKILGRCLESVANQDYPMDKIEIIVVDGGSKDETLQIAESYGVKVIHENTGRPEAATAIGYNSATGDLIINFPSDNVMPNVHWINEMVVPFVNEKDVVAAETVQYAYKAAQSVVDRYFAIFGCSDPIAFYLGKRDRCSLFEKAWPLSDNVIEKKHYFLVTFGPAYLPTLGANGYVVRRNIIQKFSHDIYKFFHIDSNVDMIRSGYNRYAFVKNSVFHLSGESFFKVFPKRLRYALIYFSDKHIRRYHLYDPKEDKIALGKFVLYSLTIIEPSIISIKAFRTTRDPACLVHIPMCFLTLMFYNIGFLYAKLKRSP